jgi:hypothetical protein
MLVGLCNSAGANGKWAVGGGWVVLSVFQEKSMLDAGGACNSAGANGKWAAGGGCAPEVRVCVVEELEVGLGILLADVW